jgi:hypothetical protein
MPRKISPIAPEPGRRNPANPPRACPPALSTARLDPARLGEAVLSNLATRPGAMPAECFAAFPAHRGLMRPSRTWGREYRRDLGHPAFNPFGLSGCLANRPSMFWTVSIKNLERTIVGQRFQHGGHSGLRWRFDNTQVESDQTEQACLARARLRKEGLFI